MMVMMKARLLPLLFLLASVTGVQVQGPQVSHVRAGEMVVLQCPRSRGSNRSGAKVVWTSHTTQGMDVITNMSSAEQMQRSMLVHMRSLVIFSASVYHQGNYSCSLGSSGRQNWFRLMVLTTQKRECEWNKTCYTEEACKLTCREEQIPNITSIGTIWHKEGVALRYAYFPSVEENDSGIYTCTSSYLYHGQIYNMTSRTMLNVQLKKRGNSAAIISPRMNDVFHVDLGSLVVIKCEAVIYSEFDEVFWLIGGSFVERNDTLPVYYNHTRVSLSETNPNMVKMTASLIFKKVSEEDLLEKYTCRLDSESQPSTNVTITLVKKSHPSYVSLALCIICIVVVMVLVVVIYIKFKVSITLLLRDTLGCRSNVSDGKSYDAFLMCYKSDTDAGLHEDDRKILESVLEARFGYSLCLFDRDVLPGRGVCPRRPKVRHVRVGEMVALQCPRHRGSDRGDPKVVWTSHTTQGMDVITDMSSAEQMEMSVLVHDRSLVILNASVNHQGNYSCSLGNASAQFWFRLTVHTTQTREDKQWTTYPATCFTQEPCTLKCPDVNAPAVGIPDITSKGVTWHKEGESPQKANYFSSVEESDSGVYTCARAFLYHGQMYNMTFTVELHVQPKKKPVKPAVILSPHMNDVFHVDLGSPAVIDCKAVMYSDYDEVFWLIGKSFAYGNNTLPVYYNYTREKNAEETKMKASLVFKKVSEEDLSKQYTCRVDSESPTSSFVTITLIQKASHLSLPLALSIITIMAVIVVTVIVCVKFKMDITLSPSDTFACCHCTSDAYIPTLTRETHMLTQTKGVFHAAITSEGESKTEEG